LNLFIPNHIRMTCFEQERHVREIIDIQQSEGILQKIIVDITRYFCGK